VSRTGGWIYYTPPNGFTNVDWFTYAIADARGAGATGTVSVLIKTKTTNTTESVNFRAVAGANGSVELSFDGIPGRAYRVQYTDSLSPPDWQTLATVAANALGAFKYTNTPPGGSSTRFYRSVYP
jgi:hypothetical protein